MSKSKDKLKTLSSLQIIEEEEEETSLFESNLEEEHKNLFL